MNTPDKKILQKVIDETSSQEDAKCVAEWFSLTIEGQQALSDMIDRDAYLMESDLRNVKVLSPVQSEIIFSKIIKKTRYNQLRRISLRVAAIVIPLFFFLGFSLYLNSQMQLFGKPVFSELYVPKGKDARICFQDGTEVFLNADSKIRYPQKFGLRKRQVYLQGEAYFNVTSNKRRPFIVHAENASVKVLGTSFNVNAYADNKDIRVTLDKGKILFNSPLNQYSMLAGQQIFYNKENGEIKVQKLSNSSDISLWKNDLLYFNDASLAEVLKTLERKYNVAFSISDARALSYSYTIRTQQNSVEEVLQELQKIAPVRFRKKEDKIDVFISK